MQFDRCHRPAIPKAGRSTYEAADRDPSLGGTAAGFKKCLISPLPGEMMKFSNGLKPPTGTFIQQELCCLSHSDCLGHLLKIWPKVASRISLSSGSLQPLVVEISSFLDGKDCQHIIDKALPHIQKSAVKHMDHEPWHLWSTFSAVQRWLMEMISSPGSYGSERAFHFRNLGCWQARCRVENQQHIFYAIWWLLLACLDLAFVICNGKGWHYRKLTQLPSTGVCKSTPS